MGLKPGEVSLRAKDISREGLLLRPPVGVRRSNSDRLQLRLHELRTIERTRYTLRFEQPETVEWHYKPDILGLSTRQASRVAEYEANWLSAAVQALHALRH